MKRYMFRPTIVGDRLAVAIAMDESDGEPQAHLITVHQALNLIEHSQSVIEEMMDREPEAFARELLPHLGDGGIVDRAMAELVHRTGLCPVHGMKLDADGCALCDEEIAQSGVDDSSVEASS